MLSREEMHILRFYEGDIEEEYRDDPFYGNPKAYVTLNSLLFDGMETENARSAENRFLDPIMVRDIERTINVMKTLINTLKKYKHEEMTVYRVERLADYRCFVKEKMFPSFISTCEDGFLDAYTDKKDLVLMKITIDRNAIAGRLEDLLDEYVKVNEKEVLIAPGAIITIKEKEVPEEYRHITDRDHAQAAVYCEVHATHRSENHGCESTVINDDMKEASVRVYEALNQHVMPQQADIEQYLQLKQAVRREIL